MWLEEEKIRHYGQDEREPLRDIGSEKWSTLTLEKYLNDLGLSWVMGKSNPEVLDQLLAIGVGLEYSEEGKRE